MADLNVSPEGFKEALGVHIRYEIDMLRYTFILLESSTALWFNGNVQNALIESFSVHARSLLEFFESRSPMKDETICAWHFADASDVGFQTSFPTQLRGKLNAQISHPSYNRTDDQQKKLGPADRRQILTLLQDELDEFDRHLKATYRECFPAEIAKNRILFINSQGVGVQATNKSQMVVSEPMGRTGADGRY